MTAQPHQCFWELRTGLVSTLGQNSARKAAALSSWLHTAWDAQSTEKSSGEEWPVEGTSHNQDRCVGHSLRSLREMWEGGLTKDSIFCAYRMDAYITTIVFIQSKGTKTVREFEDMKFTLNMQAAQEKIIYLRCVILVLRSHQTHRDSKEAPSIRIYTIFFSFQPYNIIIFPLLVQCSMTNQTVLWLTEADWIMSIAVRANFDV